MSNTTIPGDPGGLHALASQLSGAAADLDGIAARVAANEVAGWTGSGGDAYRGAINRFSGAIRPVSQAMSGAARGISSFASELESFQYTAARLAAQMAENADERVGAEARHVHASAKAASARIAHSMAHDPVTIQATRRALLVAEEAVSVAAGIVESLANVAARLEAEAAANFAAYEGAVRVCIAALSAAEPAVIGLLGAGSAAAEALAGEIDKLFVYARRDGRQVAEDGARDAGMLGLLGLFGPGLGMVPVGLLFASPRTWSMIGTGVDWIGGNPISKVIKTVDGVESYVDDLSTVRTEWSVFRFVPTSGNLSKLDRDFALETKLDLLHDLPGAKVLGRAAFGLNLLDDVSQIRKNTMMVPGEDVEGRVYTAGLNTASDAFIDWYPPANIVDTLTFGLLKTDAAAVSMIDGSAVSGFITGYQHGGLTGAVSGGVHGALRGDDVFASQVSSGSFGKPMQRFSQGENWVIDKAYSPVSAASSAVAKVATAPLTGAAHLLSKISL